MKRLKGYSSVKTDENKQRLDATEQFERAKAKYGDMDENGLLRELSRRVAEQKKNGTFDTAQTAAYVAALSPYLNERQKKALSEIIDS